MTDTPWSNRQQQMVQEYLDALLTDPETAADQPEAVEEVEAVQPVAAEAEHSVDVIAAESAVPDTLNETEELASETAEIAVLADDNVSEEFDAEPVLTTELSEAEPESEEPLELADIQTEEHLTDVAQATPAESMSEIPPDSEEALDAALHAIESVKAAEEAEAAEVEAEAETEAEVISELTDELAAEVSDEPMEAEQPLQDLPEDLAADDGISTIDDPISVAAELLHEELDQYDADPFEDAEASEPVSALQDIPEIATEPEALLPTDDSATEYEPLLADEDSVTEAVAEAEISASADLDAYVEDITNMQPVTEAPREDHHDDHDIAALLSQLAEIVSDDSVAEAVIQKIEEIAQEFSSHTQVQADAEPEAEPAVIAEDISVDILDAVDAVVNEEEICFDLSDDTQEIAEEEPSAEELSLAEEEHLSEDELAAEFAAAMAAEADMDAASAEVPAEEPAIDEDVSEIEFPAELEEVASEPEPVPAMAAAAPAEEMQCIIVEMHGLQLAMPLEHVLEPRHIADMSLVLDDQYDWVLGSFLDLNFKIDVVDTAMWLIPETYEPHNATYDEILLLQGKPWALTYDRMVTAQIISMDEVTLNTDKSRRPWLLGTSMAHKCAIVDIPALCKQLEEAL